MAPYFAIGLFAGIRPFEILRLHGSIVNLKDREIRPRIASPDQNRASRE